MDKKLVLQAKKHDKEAFVKLVENYQVSMYKTAIAILQNDEDAADAIQETILKCYEKLSTLKKDSYFKTWMIRILINNCNEMLRHKGRVFPTMEMEEGIFEESGYVDCEWKEILASLEEKYQVVMLLYYSKSLSVKEMPLFWKSARIQCLQGSPEPENSFVQSMKEDIFMDDKLFDIFSEETKVPECVLRRVDETLEMIENSAESDRRYRKEEKTGRTSC